MAIKYFLHALIFYPVTVPPTNRPPTKTSCPPNCPLPPEAKKPVSLGAPVFIGDLR